MLVLTRKLGERILIDGGIEITVVEIDRNKVRIGIEAPKDIVILREGVAKRAAIERAAEGAK